MPRRTNDQPKPGDAPAGRPRRPRRRRWPLAAAAIAVLASILYGGYWLAASRVLAEAVDDWLADMERQGRPVMAADLGVAGFPAWFRIDANRASVTDPAFGVLTASRASATARPWRWWYRADAEAEMLELRATPQGHPPIHATADRFALAVDRDSEQRRTLSVDVDVLAADQPGIAGAETIRLRVAVPDGAGGPGTEAEATVALRGVLLPQRMMMGLPVSLPQADVEARLAPWRPDLGTPAGLEAWRQEDGRLLIDRVAAVWGPMAFDARGELALDEALRPVGSVTLRANGWQEMLDAVEEAGLVEQRLARTIRLGLGLFSRPAPDGGPPTLEAPLRLEEGQVFLGPVPVARVPSLLELMDRPGS